MISRLSIFLLSLLLTLSAYAETAVEWSGKTLVVALSSDDVSDGRRMREFERMLDQAKKDGVEAVILEVDLSGNLEEEKTGRFVEIITKADLSPISWIHSTATGPAALSVLAAETIYMSPDAIVGSIGPSGIADDDDTEAARKLAQERSILKARARSLAKLHGHRVALVEAFVDGSAVFVIDEETISKAGEILTLTADEATRQIGEEPLFANGIATTVEEILTAESLPAAFIRLTPRQYGEDFNRARLSKQGEKKKGDDAIEASDEALFGKREEDSYEGKVIVLTVGQDTLATGKASFEFMDRTLKKAELDGAEAVIFDMDTPGGFAWYTEGLVLNSLQNVTYPTYTFVNSRAESAGAIVALGTDHIYMRPAATIGSALVVSGTGQDLAESMNDKVTQMIIGSVRNIAEIKGHNPDIAEAFVTQDHEVRVDGEVIHEAGNVLNLNTIRATEEVGGRPLLAAGVAQSLDDLIAQESLTGEVVTAAPLGLEAFAHWAQKLSFLLIAIGLGGAYLELNSPGFGLPGLASVCAFSLFFFGNYLAGNLAGYELAVLLVIGLILLGVEIFIFPGSIIPGVLGGALILGALGFAMVDRVDFEWKWTGLPDSESWVSLFHGAMYSVTFGLVGALGAILLGMRFLPDTKMGSRLILKDAVTGGAALSERGAGGVEMKASDLLGSTGKTITDLMPSGKGEFDGKLLDIISEGGFIEKGTGVRITAQEGSRIVVRES